MCLKAFKEFENIFNTVESTEQDFPTLSNGIKSSVQRDIVLNTFQSRESKEATGGNLTFPSSCLKETMYAHEEE